MNFDRLRRAPNIAIIGSSSPLGKELQEMLESSGLPVGKLTLLETEEYAGLLQEFAGDIQITQIISPGMFDDVDIAFFACSREIIDAYAASGAAFPELAIDLTQTRREGALHLSGVSDPALLKSSGILSSPHPAAIVLTRVLGRLHRRFGLESASVTILEPASERGAAGVNELQEQTVGLLNFQQVGSRVFDGQIAFNALSGDPESGQTENLIRDQLAALLGDGVPAVEIMTVQVPVFHSHSFALFVRLQSRPAAAELGASLEEPPGELVLHRRGGEDRKSHGAPSAVTAVGSEQIHVGRIDSGGGPQGGYALWIVADNLRVAAANALRIAESIMFASAPQR